MVTTIGEAIAINTVRVTGPHRARVIDMHQVIGTVMAMDIIGREATGAGKCAIE